MPQTRKLTRKTARERVRREYVTLLCAICGVLQVVDRE